MILDSTLPKSHGTSPASVELGDLGNDILSLHVAAPDGRNALTGDLIGEILAALESARAHPSAKVLVLRGTRAAFLSGGRPECDLAAERKLFQALAAFPFPIVASLQGDATGAGFLAAALCDFMVCNQAANYGFTDPESGLFPSAPEDGLFRLRFGAARAAGFLYGGPATGRQLLERGWTCPCVPDGEADMHALDLARGLARKSGEALRLLKQHLAHPFLGPAESLVPSGPPAPDAADAPAEEFAPPASLLEWEAGGDRILIIRLPRAPEARDWPALVSALGDMLARVKAARRFKAVVVADGHAGSLPVPEDGLALHLAEELLRHVSASPVPVIAALEQGARGLAWFMAMCCDACVHHRQGEFTADGMPDDPGLASLAAALYASRCGGHLAKEILLSARPFTGLELERHGVWAADQDQVLAQALRLAELWSRWPDAALASWKAAAALRLRQEMEGRPAPTEAPEDEASPETDSQAPDRGTLDLALRSGVVSATLHPEGMVLVRMEDRQAKNMFTEALMDGLQEAFARVRGLRACKAVILTGYDRYFATGGTKETLLAIQEGKVRFTDNKTFQIAMDCPVPVVAALQGHGIGAGWGLGMFADFALHSVDGTYMSPYMNYGFTPGAGATFIFPERAGHDLARETLLTGREYSGAELRSRGFPPAVLPGDQVLAAAFALAGHMARLPRRRLTALKHLFNDALRMPLEEAFARELEMHGKTFVGKTETLDRIHGNFVPENVPADGTLPAAPAAAPNPPAASPTAPAAAPAEPATAAGAARPAAAAAMLANLSAALKAMLAFELQMREDEIDDHMQFVDLGLDSITGVTWIRKVNERLGTSIEATKIYSHPTLAKLTRFIRDEAGGQGAPVPAPVPAYSAGPAAPAAPAEARRPLPLQPEPSHPLPAEAPAAAAGRRLASWRNRPAARAVPEPEVPKLAEYRPGPIAVIGMAGRFPQARNLEEFWANLAGGRNCITPIPRERWDADAFYSPEGPAAGKTNCRWMGSLEEYDRFDPLFFNISPTEAESMDPQQRLFLESCWQGIENAGYNPKSLSGSRCGVFVGCSGSDYLEPSRERRLSAQGFTGAATSILAARISFFLNLQGPCLSIDTACSSSLVAIATACDSLCSGGSDTALAGGVFVMAGPSLHIMASQAGMLSPDGRCYSFDQRANGFVPGEGVGVLVLKRLADAERDRDNILGVLRGWGVNQDGRTNGITAPNPESQARLEMEVYDRHGIDPSGIQLVEAHGTGTKLGDPIEVEALRKAFRKYTRKTGYCALGSVKSNIGHCLTAAGVSGVIKVLLAMKHRQLPPTINFDRLNEHVALQDSPFFVNHSLKEWAAPEGPRQAAVSSFGFSGTNAHIVLSEYSGTLPAGDGAVVLDGGNFAFPLSARTPEQLQEAARGLLAALRREGSSLDPAALAYTLQTGRDALGERLGFMADSVPKLIGALEAWLAGDASAAHRGQVQANREGMRLLAADDIQAAVVENFLSRNQVGKLLELWVKGLAFDWERLYAAPRPRRLALPGYPFARERYWIGQEPGYGNADATGNLPGTSDPIHPLLHRNVSDLAGQAYSARFSGGEACLQAGAGGGKSLSPMAFLEMARAALDDALPAEASGPVLELRDLAWEAPLDVDGRREASIRLTLAAGDRVGFEVGSSAGDGEDPERHFRGEGACLDTAGLPGLDVGALEAAGAIVVLGLPEGGAHPAYVLHPAILDSVLRACASRLAGADGALDGRLRPLALASLQVAAPCPPETLAWVRPSGAASPGPAFDIDLCDRAGKVCAALRGLALADHAASAPRRDAGSGWDGISYACAWEAQPAPSEAAAVSHAKVLIACCGPSLQLEAALLEQHREGGNAETRILRFSDRTERVSDAEWHCDSSDPEALARCLDGMESPDALYFLAFGGGETRDGGPETHLLRLAKRLKREGAGGRIDAYVLTLDAQGPEGGAGHRGAAASGLAYALAQGSARFQVRNLDLSARDLGSPESRRDLAASLLREPASDRGEIFRLREGRRYRQAFFPLRWESPARPALRQEGVYLIVGGGGTVGRILTRELIRKYRAAVVWIGRSAPESDKVRMALREAGDRADYVQADATDSAAMLGAVEAIKRRHGRIDGAIFAGMVFDFGNSIEQTTEAEFRAIAEVKIRGSRAVYAALAQEPLDFLCYFSSGQAFAFSGAAQLSAYAAGIAAADSFARSLRAESRFPVGVINWGFWKASVETIKALPSGVPMENLAALEDEEGFACFERFVGELGRGRLHQVLGMKASPQIEALMHRSRDEAVILADEPASPWSGAGIRIEAPAGKIAELKLAAKQAALEEWFIRVLHAQVTDMLGAGAADVPQSAESLGAGARVIGKYAAWWRQALGLLADRGRVRLEDGRFRDWRDEDGTALREAWSAQKAVFRQDPDCRALAELVDDCLANLPGILQGRILATDVIFPDSSMAKVEGVYKHNAVCDLFNGIVADAAVACAQSAGARVPPARLRILEIGAGTGGTSALVFDRLRPHRDAVERYTYTDLSKAFLFHAEKAFAPEFPYLDCRLLDIERPLGPQGFALGGYDLVIATNVLHATRNIRRTLRNAKAALRQGGMLVLNEMSRDSLSTHLTFGLLDGWWLFEDPELRIPGCPGLSPESWRRVLEEEGFHSVSFPAREGHELGNQIIAAFSDGVIRQAVSRPPATILPAAPPASAATAAPVPAGRLPAPAAPFPASHPSATAATAANPATAASAQALPDFVQSEILACLCGVLKIAPGIIRPDAAFSDYGVDSILGVNFIKQVNDRFGINLNTAVIFDHASLEALSRHVATAHRAQVESRWRPASAVPPAPIPAPAPAPAPEAAAGTARPGVRPIPKSGRRETRARASAGIPEIAVIGLSGMSPKAEDARAFWENLVRGVSGIEELPSRYLDAAYYSPRKQAGKTRCKWGGILAKRDCFDPLFFNISPKEAESMNPHQRLVMQESWKAIEDAGYNPRRLAGSQTGIFVGAEPTGYVGGSFTGFSDAIVASRLAYYLNLNGPAFVVNTGCSSSAVALHLACESLRHGESDLALAGGVNAAMSHHTQVRLDEIEMLSPSGRCLAFDGKADGTVISEGVGMVVLKRLEDAVADGDPIHAVICASGINQDGASNGITAPNGAAQEKLIAGVYRKFGVDPSRIGYVEAHGTGTRLGDPVEANALIRAFRAFTGRQGYCALGTAKAHIGHTAAAAGVLGLIKVILSIGHKRIPALPGLETVNPLIELEGSPFRINTREEAWPAEDGRPRMAALNSFGHSGTNAHLVIREYLPAGAAAYAPAGGGPAAFPLSAKTPEQLREKALGLLAWLRSPERDPAAGPLDVAYTLQVGREAMEERVGFIADSLDQLAGRLRAWLDGGAAARLEGVIRGTVKRKPEAVGLFGQDEELREAVAKWIARGKLGKLLELWAQGLDLDWETLHAGARPRRVRLPTYPFAEERYWAGGAASERASGEARSAAPATVDLASIGDILKDVDEDAIDAGHALKLIKNLV